MTNLLCKTVANLYMSYDGYRAIREEESNFVLVIKLVVWFVTTSFLLVCDYILDPVFASWLPLYHFAKLALVLWMVYPGTLGAYLLFVTQVDPRIRAAPHYLHHLFHLARPPSH